jgi:hypothetical protein
MDSVLILFQKKIQKVIPDSDKLFLEPSWSDSLKVFSTQNHVKIEIVNTNILF